MGEFAKKEAKCVAKHSWPVVALGAIYLLNGVYKAHLNDKCFDDQVAENMNSLFFEGYDWPRFTPDYTKIKIKRDSETFKTVYSKLNSESSQSNTSSENQIKLSIWRIQNFINDFTFASKNAYLQQYPSLPELKHCEKAVLFGAEEYESVKRFSEALIVGTQMFETLERTPVPLEKLYLSDDFMYKYIVLCDSLEIAKDSLCWIPALRPKYFIEVVE
mmetsp:Transcript_28939/g.33038  ORF Transcript_28939/g.33038 Transcript_28939/m.33038 type:complete len:217 (+) Transcript_28939:1706-2356(+)